MPVSSKSKSWFIAAAIWLLEAGFVGLFGLLAGAGADWLKYDKASFISAGTVAVGIIIIAIARSNWSYYSLIHRFSLVKWTGITRTFPVRPYPRFGGSANKSIQDAARRALMAITENAGSLNLLLVSGWHYIGCGKHQGVLYQQLSNRTDSLSLDVLLLDPDSDEARKRAEFSGIAYKSYAEGIRAVTWTLVHFANTRGIKLRIGYYQEEPIWQMVITEDELWLICARGMSAQDSPVYCLSKKEKYSIAWGLEAVWQRRWDSAKMVDLSTVRDPQWTEVHNKMAS
ncbi:hypothetical protein WME95_30775 [Sorangium sp. So ce327]|uniref:hypothetical protein n=1 Tax=Sorangium sp. So ce327 TaxID=3133301 RepID=UPI003F5EBAB3